MGRRTLIVVIAVLGVVPVLSGLLAIASLGAVPRLISVAVTGWPHPAFIGALVLELFVVPLVIWWHVRTFPRPAAPARVS